MTTGSAQLVEELQLIFAIYAKDLKTFREGGAEFVLLANQEMFDVVVKLLNVSDKIKKLDVVTDAPAEGTVKQSAPVRNIQDILLQKV